MTYNKEERLELLDGLVVTYGALEKVLGIERAKKIHAEDDALALLSWSGNSGNAAFRAAIRVWRKEIMVEIAEAGYEVHKTPDEIIARRFGISEPICIRNKF